MKYKSETGESMEKPSRKLKKTILIVGITGVVYASFQYLLPLVIPFLVAYGIALLLRPSVFYLERRMHFCIRGRAFHIPLAVIGGVEIFFVLVLLGSFFYWGGRMLFLQIQLLFDNFPGLVNQFDSWLSGCCTWIEQMFRLKQGLMSHLLGDMLKDLVREMKGGIMPFLMMNSMTIFTCFIEITVITVIIFIASILSLQEMESLKNRREQSIFYREFALVSSRLAVVGSAYLKTQGSIMLLTMTICTIGLVLLGNPYSFLLGIVIGLLDALPIFGTGTVLIPWALISIVGGNWGRGLVLLAIYIICYFLREIMEAKMMGDKVGISPLETLISMYIGLQLFGILGFILGPIGLIIIEDMVELYDRPPEEQQEI